MTHPISDQGLLELLLLLRGTDGSVLNDEPAETDDEEEAYREIRSLIAKGRTILGSTTTLADYYFGDGDDNDDDDE